MHIGNKIKELRKDKGITQELLANSIGVSFQAISKWENNIALPDITLTPVLANFFGVSMDTLFDFSLEKTEKDVLAIARSTDKYRNENFAEGVKIINEGLNNYPDNDILLQNLLYLLVLDKDSTEEVIKVAGKLIDITNDNAIRYDAFRFLAYAYKDKGDIDGARKALEQIPEIYFSRLSLMADIMEGDEKLNAAGKELSVSLGNVIDMLFSIAECLTEKGDRYAALSEYKKALCVLNVFNCFDDQQEYAKKKIIELEKSL